MYYSPFCVTLCSSKKFILFIETEMFYLHKNYFYIFITGKIATIEFPLKRTTHLSIPVYQPLFRRLWIIYQKQTPMLMAAKNILEKFTSRENCKAYPNTSHHGVNGKIIVRKVLPTSRSESGRDVSSGVVAYGLAE